MKKQESKTWQEQFDEKFPFHPYGRTDDQNIKDFIADLVEKTRREAHDTAIHLIESKIDNMTNSPKKPSDFKSYQRGFSDAHKQINRIIEDERDGKSK